MTDAPSPDAPPPYNPPPPGGAPSPYTAASAPPPGAPYAQDVPTSPPGRVLSIIGLVLAFLLPPVGLILSIIAAVQLGKAKAPKGIAIAGIIVGAILTIFAIIGIVLLVTVLAGVIGTCAELGPGVWDVGGVTYRCG